MNRYLKHNPKVVALVGMGPSIVDILSETLTQEFSPNWADEVWCINMAANIIQHDMVIWMDDVAQQQNFRPGLIEMLRRRGKPVLTSVARPEIIPNSFDYPVNEVSQFSIPLFGKPYLTNGVAMAIGYAIWKGVKVLKIYGCDFTYPNRNFAEEGRACVEAWIGLASMKGMEVQLPPSTSLFDHVSDHGIYGYSEQPEIVGPNGVKFKYVRKGEVGKYTATDSQGAQNAVSEYLPRTPGRRPGEAGERPGNGHDAGQAAAAPAAGLGEGVRPEDRHGRAQEAHHAGLNGSGAEGRIPRVAL